MARTFTKNTSNKMSLGANTINPLINGASAISYHMWVYIDSTTTGAHDNRCCGAIISSPGQNNSFDLNFESPGVRNLQVRGRSVDTDAAQIVIGSTDVPTATWHSVGAIFDYSGSIRIFLNGSLEGSGSPAFGSTTFTQGASAPTDPDGIGSGNGNPGTTAPQFAGKVAEFSVWNKNIGGPGFAMLASGYSAMFLRDGLVVYMPLIGDNSPEVDVRSSVKGTISGTLAKVESPTIYYPRRMSAMGIG